MNVIEKRQKRAEIHGDMTALIALADKEGRDLTEEEETRWTEMDTEYDKLKDEIAKDEGMEARKAKIASEKAELEKSANKSEERKVYTATVHDNAEDEEFRNFGDFVGAVYAAGRGEVDKRVQQMKNATSGGFLVPEKFISEILAVEPEDAVVKSRSRILSSSVPPDAEVRIPALDQGTNDYGGIQIFHQGESDTLTESNAEVRQVTLKPHKLTGYVTMSNEIMNNAVGFSGFIQGLVQGAMTDATETDYISGNGVNKALGFLNALGRLDINRTGAAAVAYQDVENMLARRLMRGTGNWVWLASQDILPQLTSIGDGTNNIYVTNAAAVVPDTLMGISVVYNSRMPGLGSRGDLCLVDLSKYIIADGSGPSMMLSEHARFQNDEVAMRLTFRTDGQAWLNAPIAPKGGGATQSPFVILK